MMWWLIFAAVVVGLFYGIRWFWRVLNIPPSGYTFGIVNEGGEFEKVALYDTDGKCIATEYTSVYGLHGAARKCISEAYAKQRITMRGEKPMARFKRTYPQRSDRGEA